jgi:hypothetical protein
MRCPVKPVHLLHCLSTFGLVVSDLTRNFLAASIESYPSDLLDSGLSGTQGTA